MAKRRAVPPQAAVRRGSRADPGLSAARAVVLRALSGLRFGELELRLPSGETRRFRGAAPGPSVTVTVADENVFRRLATRPQVGLGDAYVAGEWRTDDLPGLVELVVRNLEVRLFLDESMTYSCAVWEDEAETLEEAQRRKLRLVAEKLRLGPDDHVLEIGCGWGSFALLAASDYGCRVTGLTFSEAQWELARRRVAEAGLTRRVGILYGDYRTMTGRFTKVASIEMIEAIGYEQFPVFFATCDRLLEPDGLACVQTIAVPDHQFERYRRSRDWIQHRIFPGSLIPSVGALAAAMEKASRLRIHSLEDIGPNYIPTLRAWRERFFASLAEVRRLGYDERFVRVWDFYLASSEALFATRTRRDVQLVLARSR